MIKNQHTQKSRNIQKVQGQGLVEYAIILVIVGVLIYLIFLGGKAALKWYQGRNTQSSETPVPALSGEGEIEKIVETGKTVEVVETETATTNNCYSSTPIEIDTQRTRSVEHLVIIEGQGGIAIADIEIEQIPLLKFLKISIEGKYGVQDKQIEQRTYTIKFSTSPYKFATHTVAWKYTWYIGQATVKNPDGTVQIYTYKVRALLEPETTSIEQDCAQIPASITPTP